MTEQPEPDETEPAEEFRAQWLNQWPEEPDQADEPNEEPDPPAVAGAWVEIIPPEPPAEIHIG